MKEPTATVLPFSLNAFLKLLSETSFSRVYCWEKICRLLERPEWEGYFFLCENRSCDLQILLLYLKNYSLNPETAEVFLRERKKVDRFIR